MIKNQKVDPERIGANVKKIRKLQCKTQEEFAELIDVDVKTVVNIEKGHVIPQIQTLSNIAQNSNKSIDEIIGIG